MYKHPRERSGSLRNEIVSSRTQRVGEAGSDDAWSGMQARRQGSRRVLTREEVALAATIAANNDVVSRSEEGQENLDGWTGEDDAKDGREGLDGCLV